MTSALKTVRLFCTVVMLGAMLTVTAAGPARAGTCEPRTGHRVVYTDSTYRVLYVIRLCTDAPSVFYGSEVERREASGFGLLVNTDGVAPCTDRVCRTVVGINHTAPEIAGYRSNIFWFIGAVAPVDQVPWRVCATASGRSGCRAR